MKEFLEVGDVIQAKRPDGSTEDLVVSEVSPTQAHAGKFQFRRILLSGERVQPITSATKSKTVFHYKNTKREARNKRELQKINKHSSSLNKETKDTLKYQDIP